MIVEVARRRDATGEVTHRSVQGLFLLLGAEARDWLPSTVALDDRGFVLTGRDIPRERWVSDRPPETLATTVPGIFAVGDPRRLVTGRRSQRRGCLRRAPHPLTSSKRPADKGDAGDERALLLAPSLSARCRTGRTSRRWLLVDALPRVMER